MFLNAVRIGDHVYGTTGDFGPAFLTALDVKTGRSAWQHRGFGRASLVHADGKLIIMDEDGDLALAKVSPEKVEVLAEARIFDTTTWTAPTLVGTRLYARDREKIVALQLGDPSAPATAPATAPSAIPRPGPTRAPAGPAVAPGAPLAGTWKLDAAASRIDNAAGLAGLIGAGVPPMLFVTQPANGTILVESPINEGHARMHHPGAKTTTPVGQGGSITMASTWAGRTLVSDGTLVNAAGVSTPVTERYTVSEDGNTLSIDVTAAASAASALAYSRMRSVGPCETWPTPCKRAP